jgi:uncharacterized protein DUF2750
MSIAAAQYDKFKEQVVNEGRAYTFTDNGELLVYPVHSGETVPFWSSRSRLETIQKRLPKYRQWQITQLTFAEFWERLAQLERENVQIGANWSGAQLMGYNVAAADLRAGLLFYINKYSKHHLLDAAT